MERIKVFFSYILTIIFTIALTYIVINSFLYTSINYKNINKSLTKNRINYLAVGKVEVDDELYNFLDLDDIINDYVANKTIYELGMADNDPRVDRDLVNKKIKIGLDAYITYRIENYEGGLSGVLDEFGVNAEIKRTVIEELSKKYNIDYENIEFIKQSDLDNFYKSVDDGIKNHKKYLDVVKVLTNKEYKKLAIIILVLSLILLAIVNFNIIAVFTYTIVPLIINIVLQAIILLASSNINFTGTDYANLLNDLMHYFFVTSIEFIVVLGVILFIDAFIYLIIKNINIEKSHKKGKATLDTLFDDYDKDRTDEIS